jgi:hypothetical protein
MGPSIVQQVIFLSTIYIFLIIYTLAGLKGDFRVNRAGFPEYGNSLMRVRGKGKREKG